jgi:hypothetical protein
MVGIVRGGIGAATVVEVIVRVFFTEIAENRDLLVLIVEWITTLKFFPSYF